VPTTGKAIYGAHRAQWLPQRNASVRPAAETLYEELDALSAVRKQACEALTAKSRRHAITRVLETAPGMGPVRMAETGGLGYIILPAPANSGWIAVADSKRYTADYRLLTTSLRSDRCRATRSWRSHNSLIRRITGNRRPGGLSLE
jgi:hypothetical protein